VVVRRVAAPPASGARHSSIVPLRPETNTTWPLAAVGSRSSLASVVMRRRFDPSSRIAQMSRLPAVSASKTISGGSPTCSVSVTRIVPPDATTSIDTITRPVRSSRKESVPGNTTPASAGSRRIAPSIAGRSDGPR